MEAAATRAQTAQPTARQASLLILLTSCVAHYWTCLGLTSEVALDVDPINLLYAMGHFNPAHHAPHPPGYLVYVGLLRGLRSVVGDDPFGVVQLLSRLFSTATIPLVYAAVRRLRPADDFAAGLAAVLAAFHPFLLYHGVDAQTHTSEAFAAALLLLVLVRYRQCPSATWAIAAGAVLALGSAFRPSFVVAGVGPIAWAIGLRRPAHLGVAGVVSIVGAVGWLVPTFEASGGYALWRLAQDALVSQTFLRTSSPFSDEASSPFVWFNFRSTLAWLFLALAPALLVAGVRRGRANPSDEAYQTARSLAVASAAPSVLFYLAMFCSEPGYLLGFVPPVIAATALAATPDLPTSTRRATVALAVASQLAVLVLPASGGMIGKMPSIPELVRRDVLYRTASARLTAHMPPDSSVLFVTDYPDLVLSRQLPVRRPSLHAMIVFSEHWPIYERTSIGLATEDDWIPIPGPALLSTGPSTRLDVPFVYDFVVVDPLASSDLRRELERLTDCDVSPAAADGVPLVLPTPACFPEGILEVHGQGVRLPGATG